MGSLKEHIQQAVRNLKSLSKTNTHDNDAWDWQVTMCFYTAVHMINGHISQSTQRHYRSHKQVFQALNPSKQFPLGCELPEQIYLSYRTLMNYSRRSRYLCKDAEVIPEGDTQVYFTNSRHLKKSVHHLDVLMTFITEQYAELGVSFPVVELDCIDLRGKTFRHFTYKEIVRVQQSA